MREIRWHARAGQGAKTASELLALALLRAGKSVQSFPEYGPERRGSPMRAYTRVDERPIRRHDAVTEPDVAVVLDPALTRGAVEGLAPDGVVLVNAAEAPPGLDGRRVVAVPDASGGPRFANLVMVGAVAAELGEPALEDVQDAAVELLGGKANAEAVRAAVEEGYRCRS
jgi:pyruvate ferredoxin oxidoreductase gamma subunit